MALSVFWKVIAHAFCRAKLRTSTALQKPTVIIVVDRVDLDTQITATFSASDIPNLNRAARRDDLMSLLKNGTRKIVITTIHKFGETDSLLNDRSNIILLVDEAHRTQKGDLGQKMRKALPNAFSSVLRVRQSIESTRISLGLLAQRPMNKII